MSESNNICIWENPDKLKEIRTVLYPNLSESEFEILTGIGKATNLNPFLKEVWAVKYGNNSANIFIGRDGYRKAAQRQSEYDFHYTECVCKNDEFEVVNGIINHKFKFADRGELLGAYCVVKKRHSSQPVYSIVDFKEYNKKQSVWNTMPRVMIQKCAEAVALRMAFQGVFSGTYSEYEQWEDKKTSKPVIDIKSEVEYTTESKKNPLASKDQMAGIESLMCEVEFSSERKEKAFKFYDISSVDELSIDDADHFLQMLRSIKDQKVVEMVKIRQAEIDKQMCA